MKANQQLRLPFPPIEETRAERLERILSGKLGHKVKPLSEVQFDYAKASQHARDHRTPPKCIQAHGQVNRGQNTLCSLDSH